MAINALDAMALMPDSMTTGFIVKTLLSFGLGAVLGVDRRPKQMVAGVRTHMIIAGGSCLISACGIAMLGDSHIDSTRLAGQILSGIGFVGAGAIIRKGNTTLGVTTAATLFFAA